jgi:hypothetical protein
MVTSRHHQRTLLDYETALQHLLALLTVKLSATLSHGQTTHARSHAGESHTASEHRSNHNTPRIWPGSPTKIVTRAQLDERCVSPTPVCAVLSNISKRTSEQKRGLSTAQSALCQYAFRGDSC